MRSQIAQDWLDRSRACIAQGALTNSKRPETFVEGVYPTHVTHGEGAYVYDVDGRKYFDFICGLGSNLFGYDDYYVGSNHTRGSYSLGSTLEVMVAERLKELFPFVDKMKFLKTGTEACNAAIRIARAWTGRDLIISEGYHGWGDTFISLDAPAAGIPNSDQRIVKLDEATPYAWETAAAVIVEPVMIDYSPTRRQWLEAIREKCTKHGVMLIFDEVITGFRFPKFSVARHWSITPDLICLGKAFANGLPLSVVAGKAAVMDNPAYFVSSTFAGDMASLAAARMVMSLLATENCSMNELWNKGQDWLDRFNEIWPEKIWLEGYPTRAAFKGDDMVKALFWQEAVRAGILFGPSWFFNFPMAQMDLSVQLQSLKEILCKIKNGQVKLEGKMPVPPKAQMMRDNKR